MWMRQKDASETAPWGPADEQGGWLRRCAEEPRPHDERVFVVNEAALPFGPLAGTTVETDRWHGVLGNAGYRIEVPKNWNGILVVHSYGGPRLAVPEPDDALEDLKRFAVTVEEGYAWAGSNYRREGYGVRMAAEDTENLRKIAWQKLGKPKLTLLHGQSWGGNVAAKAAELYTIDGNGQQVYDGVVLTSGLLGGGSRGNYGEVRPRS